ncbi:MAG: hypothetical protein JW725_01075 [Candidatus Babeliaceae bacterium]|nr:hypothetical protein [Candidatus Babeliaceae bacterium]
MKKILLAILAATCIGGCLIAKSKKITGVVGARQALADLMKAKKTKDLVKINAALDKWIDATLREEGKTALDRKPGALVDRAINILGEWASFVAKVTEAKKAYKELTGDEKDLVYDTIAKRFFDVRDKGIAQQVIPQFGVIGQPQTGLIFTKEEIFDHSKGIGQEFFRLSTKQNLTPEEKVKAQKIIARVKEISNTFTAPEKDAIDLIVSFVESKLQ